MYSVLVLILYLFFSPCSKALGCQSNSLCWQYVGARTHVMPIFLENYYGDIDYSDIHHGAGIFHGFWISDKIGVEYAFTRYSPKDRYKYYGNHSPSVGDAFHILTSEYSLSSFDVGIFFNILNAEDTSLIGLIGISRSSIRSKYDITKHHVYLKSDNTHDVSKETAKRSIKTSGILPHVMISIDQLISEELMIRASIDWKKFSSFRGKNYFFHDHHIDIRIKDSVGCSASIMFRF